MIGVDEDDFIVLVDTILVDPVRVQDSQISTATTNTLFSSAAETTLELKVVDTLTDRLAIGST